MPQHVNKRLHVNTAVVAREFIKLLLKSATRVQSGLVILKTKSPKYSL